MTQSNTKNTAPSCSLSNPDYSGVKSIDLSSDSTVKDFGAARLLADREASDIFNNHMLVSWYDRDRDLESPQHTGDCSGIPGYIEYGLSRGSTLKVDIDEGRFVFFYKEIDF